MTVRDWLVRRRESRVPWNMSIVSRVFAPRYLLSRTRVPVDNEVGRWSSSVGSLAECGDARLVDGKFNIL